MTDVTGDWLSDSGTQQVFALLKSAGFQIYAVGGCVRNSLLNMPVADVDFATDARPEQVIDLARSAGLHAVPTGIEHGTVTLVVKGVGHEVTTFRKDVVTDGRRAIVVFATTPEEDARRRDFTMNALYSDADGAITDPIQGLADLKARRVRFIGDAHDRIREDALRILRFFRFHAWFGDPEAGIDPEALAACAELADGVGHLSRERVGAEFLKLLSAPDPAPGVASMEHAGILMRILPGATAAPLAPLVHLEGLQGFSPDSIRRLAALGGEDAKERLRLSKADDRRLIRYHEFLTGSQQLAELAYRFSAVEALDIVLLRAAVLGASLPEDMRAMARQAAQAVFPVRASDLPPELTGPALGLRLRELEADWIASGFTLSKDALLAR